MITQNLTGLKMSSKMFENQFTDQKLMSKNILIHVVILHRKIARKSQFFLKIFSLQVSSKMPVKYC